MELSNSDLINPLPILHESIKTRSAVARESKRQRLESVQATGIVKDHAPPSLQETMQYEVADAGNVEGEYPFLAPDMSIPEIKEGMIEIQSILQALQIEPLRTIPLPKLHVAGFPDRRFHVDKKTGCIKIMYCQWMKEFIDYVGAKLSKKRFGSPIALTGPKGIGKSHCLYLLVAILRKKVDKYRVFYIPSCSYLLNAFESQGSNRKRLAQDLIVSFPDDDARPLIDNFWTNGGLYGCLSSLAIYYRIRKIRIILVLDQHNFINVDRVEGKCVVDLINQLSTFIPTLISFPAHSNVAIKRERFDIYVPQNYLVGENEALAFCRLFCPEISDLEAEDTLSVVGGVPLESATCLQYDGKLDEKIKTYCNERAYFFFHGIKKYFQKLIDRKWPLDQTLEDMSTIIVRAGQQGKRHYEFDRKLILEMSGSSSGSYSYSFINHIALNTVWSFLISFNNSTMMEKLDSIAKSVVSFEPGHAAKSLKCYIIMRSCLYRSFTVKQLDINVENLEIHYFTPATLESILFYTNTILVPSIANLAGFDFVVYEQQCHRVYLVQVTVEELAAGHRDKSKTALTNCESQLFYWLTRLKNAFGIHQPQYYEIYITNSETGAQDRYNSVKISEMAVDYPGLVNCSI